MESWRHTSFKWRLKAIRSELWVKRTIEKTRWSFSAFLWRENFINRGLLARLWSWHLKTGNVCLIINVLRWGDFSICKPPPGFIRYTGVWILCHINWRNVPHMIHVVRLHFPPLGMMNLCVKTRKKKGENNFSPFNTEAKGKCSSRNFSRQLNCNQMKNKCKPNDFLTKIMQYTTLEIKNTSWNRETFVSKQHSVITGFASI